MTKCQLKTADGHTQHYSILCISRVSFKSFIKSLKYKTQNSITIQQQMLICISNNKQKLKWTTVRVTQKQQQGCYKYYTDKLCCGTFISHLGAVLMFCDYFVDL